MSVPLYGDRLIARVSPGVLDNNGPGTHLKKLLVSFGIHSESKCGCSALAAEMNARGSQWCLANIDLLAAKMANEASKRDWMKFIPAKEFWAQGLIRMAVSKSRS